MSVVLGSGEYTFTVAEGWGTLPESWGDDFEFGDVGSVGVDRDDNVYVFSRSDHPMTIFDRDGNFLTSWGEDIFTHAHGISMGPDDTIYCTDNGDHTVRKCTLEGKILLEIGIPGQSSGFMSGKPFCQCTHTALSPEGDIYVTDGYGNAQVHKFSPDGKLLFSWGESGTDPGQFNLPHNVACDADGWVYVADRENHRVQIFDANGKFETQWNNMTRPNAFYATPGSNPICYVGESRPAHRSAGRPPNLGPRISIFTHKGELITRLGKVPSAGLEPGQFLSPHGIHVDSHGDIYVGEVSVTAWPAVFPGEALPKHVRSLQKLVRVES